jgi:outer membrane protein OmpA-like peptidoglycan-associated protein
MEEIARFLRANAAMNVIITGHTDAQGSFEHNLGLSMRRAQSVIGSLTRDFGIAAGRLTPFGAGMGAPVASNDNDSGRQQNRRVEIVKR